MSKQKKTVLGAALLCSLLLVVSVVEGLANGTPAIDWHVIGSGGGHAQASTYGLDGTIGQPVVGRATDTGSELCSGFWWCGAAVTAVEYKIYLPLVLRNY